MLDSERGLLHIHIPKTAGTSIKHALFGARAPTRHQLARQFDRETWERNFSFAVVRNPYDRLCSAYLFHVKSDYRGAVLARVPELKVLTFEKYLREFANVLNRIPLFASQCEYVTHPTSAKPIDHLARFESLSVDLQPIWQRFVVETPLPHLLKLDRHGYRDYYTRVERRLVEDWYGDDLDRFGYSF